MHPLTTQQQTYTDALNATLITRNGNEFMMQNDMGNTLIQDSKTGNIMGLREGFVPVGIKEHGGVMYIASVNKDGDGEIGTIPSPVIEFNQNQAETKNHNIELSEQTLVPIVEDTYLNCGDKFAIVLDLDDDDITIKYWSTNGISYHEQEDKYHTLTTSISDSNYATNRGLYKLKLFSKTANNIYDISYLTEQKYTTFIKQNDQDPVPSENWYYNPLNKSDENSEVLAEDIQFDIDKMLIQDQAEGNNQSFIKYPNLPEGQLYISLEKEKLNSVQLSTNPYTENIHPITINEDDGSYSLVFPQIWYDSDCAEHIDKIQVRVKNSKNELCILKDTASWCEGGSKITDTTLTFEIDKNTLCRGKMQNDRWFRLYSSELGSSFPVTEAQMKNFYSNSQFDNLFVLENATLNEWYTLEIDCYQNLNQEELIYKYNCRFNQFYFDIIKDIRLNNIVPETKYNGSIITNGLFKQYYNHNSESISIDVFQPFEHTITQKLTFTASADKKDYNGKNGISYFKLTSDGQDLFKEHKLPALNDGNYLYGISDIKAKITLTNNLQGKYKTLWWLGIGLHNATFNKESYRSALFKICSIRFKETGISVGLKAGISPYEFSNTHKGYRYRTSADEFAILQEVDAQNLVREYNNLYIDLTSDDKDKISSLMSKLSSVNNRNLTPWRIYRYNNTKYCSFTRTGTSGLYRLYREGLYNLLDFNNSIAHNQYYFNDYANEEIDIINLTYKEGYDSKLTSLLNQSIYSVIPQLNITMVDSTVSTTNVPSGYYKNDEGQIIKETCNLDISHNFLDSIISKCETKDAAARSTIKADNCVIPEYNIEGAQDVSISLSSGIYYININTVSNQFNITLQCNNFTISLSEAFPDGIIIVPNNQTLIINTINFSKLTFNSFGIYKITYQPEGQSILDKRLAKLMNDTKVYTYLNTDVNKYAIPQAVYNFKETNVNCLDKVYNFNIAPAEGYQKQYGTYEWDKNYPNKTTVDLKLPDGTTMSNVQYRFKDEEL